VNTHAQSTQAWRIARQRVAAAGGMVVIPKSVPFPHPRDAGARPTITWPMGQLADYAIELEPSAAPLLVREFSDRYEAFLDGIHLAARAIQLAERRPAAAMYVGGALLGAAIGTAISNKREGAFVGAGLGVLLAAIAYSALRDKS
jgi:hypothetical protein